MAKNYFSGKRKKESDSVPNDVIVIEIEKMIRNAFYDAEYLKKRKNALASGLVIGVSGSGKSHWMRKEMRTVLENTEDKVVIVDFFNEYDVLGSNYGCKSLTVRNTDTRIDLSQRLNIFSLRFIHDEKISSRVLAKIFDKVYGESEKSKKTIWLYIDNADFTSNLNLIELYKLYHSAQAKGIIVTSAIQDLPVHLPMCIGIAEMSRYILIPNCKNQSREVIRHIEDFYSTDTKGYDNFMLLGDKTYNMKKNKK